MRLWRSWGDKHERASRIKRLQDWMSNRLGTEVVVTGAPRLSGMERLRLPVKGDPRLDPEARKLVDMLKSGQWQELRKYGLLVRTGAAPTSTLPGKPGESLQERTSNRPPVNEEA